MTKNTPQINHIHKDNSMLQVQKTHHDTFMRTFNGKYIRDKTAPGTIEQIRSMVHAGDSMKCIARTLNVSLELARGVRDGRR